MEYYRTYFKELFAKEEPGRDATLAKEVAAEILNKLTDQEVARLMLAMIEFRREIEKEVLDAEKL